MKINLPRITRPVPLTDYAPELVDPDGRPVVVHVWVNPPRAVLDRYRGLLAQSKELQAALDAADENDVERLRSLAAEIAANGAGFADWYAALWSQHPDAATHWDAAAVRELGASETDPALYSWLTGRSWDLVAEHRSREKKG